MSGTNGALRFRSLAEVVRLIEAFEDQSLPRASWKHGAHLTVAIWYMLNYEEAQATEKVIEGIRAYNRAQGIRQTATGGYHETITLFWLAMAQRFLEQVDGDGEILEPIRAFLERYGESPRLHLEYYSAERIRSWQARNFWIEPDLRPIDA